MIETTLFEPDNQCDSAFLVLPFYFLLRLMKHHYLFQPLGENALASKRGAVLYQEVVIRTTAQMNLCFHGRHFLEKHPLHSSTGGSFIDP